MRATASEEEGNRVRLSVEIDEDEVDEAVRQTARRLSSQLKVPGFRPGKVPRQVLEARLGGSAVLREQAIRDVLPDMYAQAVVDTEVDPIAPPDIDIVSGTENGVVSFDAVVEVRPSVAIPGYAGLLVTLPPIEVSDEDVESQIDRLREQFGELVGADRPAIDHDHVTIDLRATRSEDEDFHVEDYLYEVGSGSDVPGLDEKLHGAVPGDIFEFEAKLPAPDGSESESTVKVLVKDVKRKVLPEPTDEWASEASEFETLEQLREDLRSQMSRMRLAQAQMALQERSIAALVGLVEQDPPSALVDAEVEERIHDLAHRLEGRKITVGQFLDATGQDQQQFIEGLRAGAERSVKADLALRALAEAEDLQVSDDELEEYLSGMAAQSGLDVGQVRERIDRNGRLAEVRSQQRKAKAVDWLLEHVELVDENGDPVERSALKLDGEKQTSLVVAGQKDEGEEGADMESAG